MGEVYADGRNVRLQGTLPKSVGHSERLAALIFYDLAPMVADHPSWSDATFFIAPRILLFFSSACTGRPCGNTFAPMFAHHPSWSDAAFIHSMLSSLLPLSRKRLLVRHSLIMH